MSNVLISPVVARAMSAAVDRANEKTPEQLAQIVRWQQEQIEALETTVAQLREQLRHDANAPLTANGRPVMTLSDAARRAGIPYYTAFRYVQDEWWEADQDDSRRWLVYADKPLTVKPRAKRSRKA